MSYHEYGARLYPQQDLEWTEWSLQELLENCGVVPLNVNGLPSNRLDEYVNKLAGWVNRLNEIRDRLRCSTCGEIMIPEMKYAKNLAAYNATVVSCKHGIGHDLNVYLNHCWGCEAQIIDSRECKVRIEGYYLCLRCGSGPKNSQNYRQGDVCPNCGYISMTESKREFICPNCSHQIYLPPEQRLTGKASFEQRQEYLRVLLSA